MSEKNLCVLFGGQSSEHDISVISAGTFVRNLDRERYGLYLVYVDRAGVWRLWEQDYAAFSDEAAKSAPTAALLPGRDRKARLFRDDCFLADIDLCIPVFHGKNGEDGTIQGFFEILGVPYVGCGVLASAAGMDKMSTKRIVRDLGIRQADCVFITGTELRDKEAKMDEAEAKLGYPMFVKPSNAGSSIGVSCARDRAALSAAIDLAAANDGRILIEEAIVGREIECAVLGNLEPAASGVGEILSAESFYTFDAKYANAESRTVTDPDLPAATVEEIRRDAVAIFRALDGRGLSRVDFFVENATGEVVFNEINTMPGFTPISMYPMLWAARGVETKELVEKLIELGMER